LSSHFLNIPAVYRIGTKWIACIPRPLAYAISQSIAFVSYLSYRKTVDNVKANLMKALPSMSGADISVLTRRLFMNYSKYLVDYGRFTGLNRKRIIDKIISYEGKENLHAALAMEKGIILLTAHLGNWELGGIFFGSYGLKTNVVTMKDSNDQIDEVRRSYREQYNVNTITIGTSPFSTIEMLNALNNGEMIAMLIDRCQEGLDYLETDFFGFPARFPKGPFTLSRLTGAPIIVAFVVREGKGYKGIIETPLVVKEESEEALVLEHTVNVLERYILKYPDQWYNFTAVKIGGI
jgi:lauroyl/myristoyl acyltransferase